MDMQAVGRRIKTAREEAHITQEELAARIGCTPQHISAIERGVKTPKLETFVTIANTLNIPSDFLLQDVLTICEEDWEVALAKALEPLSKHLRYRVRKALTLVPEQEKFRTLVRILRKMLFFLMRFQILRDFDRPFAAT